MVDVSDLGILAANYGVSSGATWAMGDFTGDGAVDVGDLGILAANYGEGTGEQMNFAALNENDRSPAAEMSDCPGMGFSLIVELLVCVVLILTEFFMKGAM